MKLNKGTTDRVGSARTEARPTPVWISRRTRTLLLLDGLVALVLLMRLLMGLTIVAVVVLVPILIAQLISFIDGIPDYAANVGQSLRELLEPLSERGLLPSAPEEFMANLGEDLLNLAQQMLVGLLGFISGTFDLVLTLFGVLFVAVYLLANIRSIKANYLRMMPHRYRRDALEPWDVFAFSLSRYLSGLGLVAFIQGALSAVALFFLGLPYAILLGTRVSISSIVPYLGAFSGRFPPSSWPSSSHRPRRC